MVCPRQCGAYRLTDERGLCCTRPNFGISSYGPHFDKDPLLVGTGGSGTIFVTLCNLACCIRQNSDISQSGGVTEITLERLAGIMVRLDRAGCHNINIVTPSHIVPQLVQSISIAAGRGLSVLIVYNSSGYKSVETLRLLDGIVDLYVPDANLVNDVVAAALSPAPVYVKTLPSALRDMYRQVGDIVVRDGVAVHGLIVWHLVLLKTLPEATQSTPGSRIAFLGTRL